MSQYNVECKKWSLEACNETLERAKVCGHLARATTLEGHYCRIMLSKSGDKAERDESLAKYWQKYAAVDPRLIHLALRAEVDKVMGKK